jgi:hypothetical protein
LIKQYIRFHCEKHPEGMGASEVEALLTGMLQQLPKIKLSVGQVSIPAQSNGGYESLPA